MRKPRPTLEGMTLIEIMVVTVIIAIAMSGIGMSMGALAHTNLKAGAGKLVGASRWAYNRAVVKGTTVRITFSIPGDSLSIQEAHGKVTLARAGDERRDVGSGDDEGGGEAAADPWAAAQNRINEALKPSLGASPFGPIESASGKTLKRYEKIKLPRRVQIVKLIVPHEPYPKESGTGSIHFFPGGQTEHAVIQFSDGTDQLMSLEIHPLTGRARIHKGAYEPDELLDNPDEPDVSEVDE